MKLSRFLSVASLVTVVFVTSCSKKPSVYNLKGEVDERMNDAKVMLISFNNGDTLGETIVADGQFFFTDTISEPVMAQVRIGGRAAGTVILEDGEILFQPAQQKVSGTPLNNMLSEFYAAQSQIIEQANQIDSSSDEGKSRIGELEKQYNASEDSMMYANMDNPVGASILIDKSYDMDLEELEGYVAKYPSLSSYSRLNKMIDSKRVAAETGEGKPYKDFEIEYEGNVTRLSELMQPGHYTLVDFWASWCGPCRREIPVIKELLQQYGSQGLDVVGVAVWDEPDATKNAIEELELSWPVIINAQTVPTDMYGVLGIPAIFLISPDGIIISRGKQGDELRAAVAEVFEKN